MLESNDQRKFSPSSESISRCIVSCTFVLLTQSALSLVPLFFSASPILLQLSLSALLQVLAVGFGRVCRRVTGLRASAPAFVFFNILFVWGVYIAVVRKAVSRLADIIFNGEIIMIVTGLCSILSSDPGFVAYSSTGSDELTESSGFKVQFNDENSLSQRRVRYCKNCKAYIKGFDHHCPAFGNCIGQNNYALFMVLIVGFIIAEASYLVFSSQFVRKSGFVGRNMPKNNPPQVLAVSTMLFSLLQVLWQVGFLMWHVYCVCFNIRTDEWINWKKYPEFQMITQSQSGESFTTVQFRNPYDKGILQNLKEFYRIHIFKVAVQEMEIWRSQNLELELKGITKPV
ncbi:probable palmitoyltransferase ZDHHC12 isoform X2 [Carica papaya]|uniref:probable palmitoyltransferase ZDHHC12 isoform X2 n=1 Tax=Carica papaya TaxID=3649 RepID=UPI000B8C9419|nr:probable palmitoyltransferase ZDHHC12 isoform X2 [Carica papaya]